MNSKHSIKEIPLAFDKIKVQIVKFQQFTE